jgi:AcrR family transcriptional regulator
VSTYSPDSCGKYIQDWNVYPFLDCSFNSIPHSFLWKCSKLPSCLRKSRPRKPPEIAKPPIPHEIAPPSSRLVKRFWLLSAQGATIEELANHAQVSPTTIYKYFESKEVLFSEAISEIYQRWVIWAYNGKPPGGSLETTLDAGRKLFWVKQSHPLFAKILHNTLRDPSFVISATKSGAEAVFKNYAELGILKKEDFDQRFILWSYCYAGILTSVHLTEDLSPTQAEESSWYCPVNLGNK